VLVAEVEEAVAALEAAAAAAGGTGAAAANAAWVAAWPAVDAALTPLRRVRALVAGGGDAEKAVDALLARAARAMPPLEFTEAGGEASSLVVSGGTVRCTKGGGWNYAHAATGKLAGGVYELELGAKLNYLYVALGRVDKDISSDGSFHWDTDMWSLSCEGGYLWSGGGYSEGLCPSVGRLELDYDVAQNCVVFRQAGQELGRLTGLADEVKLIVSMGSEGTAVNIV
jgi:hypothetical protein